ncbi:MAG: DNA polymerase III subunit alpha [Coriobacteriia bacterium]|nr:DNA polymerase III subunit alpha [Coriobacteriia bacterium]
MSFVHLHTHSEYSMLDGAARVKQLVARAVDLEMPALAITDHGYMYGAVDFYRTTVNAGVKPLIGCEVYFTPERKLSGGKPDLYHLLLLAKDNEGYRNLMALVSDAAVSGFYYKPQVDLSLLEKYCTGLICTSACMSGIVSKSVERGTPEEAERWAKTYAELFAPGDFYIELQEQGITTDNGVSQIEINRELARIAARLGLGLVGTNDIHYLERADAETHDLLLCIGTGSTVEQQGRLKFSCDQFYMKTPDEMAEALSGYPEALANTLEVAEKCNVSMEFGKIILPAFPLPEKRTAEEYLQECCMEGLKKRYGDPVPTHVLERLDDELEVINDKGLAAYFLIVSDFTQWAKDAGIGVGPGRGSAAGSIISYSLGITNLDPIEQGLLFERFLNPERTEMPDIDMDFDDERRNEVIDYVRDKYGDDRVAQIITFDTMKARAAVRDAGRVLGYPYNIPDRISKMIPRMPLDLTISQALFGDAEKRVPASPELAEDYRSNPDTKRIVDAARSIEGITRNEGVHAAGVVISPDPLDQHLPVKRDTKGGSVITQYNGPTVADLGLLKMDFLGLRTLTVIASALAQIHEIHGIRIDIDTIPMDDTKTWKLLQRGDTDGVFQVESPGMKSVLKQLKPTVFADLVAVVALYRPGPMDSIPNFIKRKHGKAPISYYDERLMPILEETYGLMVYQEQVMRISMEMAGFTAAKADKLRKGMGKKIKAIMDELHPQFIEGSLERGYGKQIAEQLWNDIAEFAKYAFNKSHAAAYGLLSYQTAYLKAHYPLEYMAAVLTSYTGRTDKTVHYLVACSKAGIAVLPPDVNSSGAFFTTVDGSIRFGLAGIRGVGEGVVERIVKARETGPFTSLQDFCDRVDFAQMNKKTFDALIKAGAFDSTGYTRKHLMSLMDPCVDAAAKRHQDKSTGQVSMFDMFAPEDHGFAEEVPPPNGDEWAKKMKLAFEKEMLGIYVSDHPLSEVADAVRNAADYSLAEIAELEDGASGWFAGIITALDRRPTKRGTMMANVLLEDIEGSAEAIFFPQMYERCREILQIDNVVRIRGKIEDSDRGKKIMAYEAEEFDERKYAVLQKKLVVKIGADALTNGQTGEIRSILKHFPGKDPIELHVWDQERGKTIKCRMSEEVDSSAGGLRAELIDLFGADAIKGDAG